MGELPTGTVTFLFTDIEAVQRRHRDYFLRLAAEGGALAANMNGDVMV